MEGRVDQPDGSRIDVAEHVAPHHLVWRADAGAGGAADAPEGVDEIGILPHGRAAVVDEHVVQLASRPVRAADERGVAGDRLAGGRARQQAHLGHRVLEGREQLLVAAEDHVHVRQGRDHGLVALVGHDHRGPTLRDQRVGSGHPHPGRQEVLAQLGPGESDLLHDVLGGHSPAGRLGERLSHLPPAEVDRRHHHVGRRLPSQLDDPLAEVGFHRAHAARLQDLVEVDLLAHHRLALDQDRRARAPAESQDVLGRLLGSGGLDHDRAVGLGL